MGVVSKVVGMMVMWLWVSRMMMAQEEPAASPLPASANELGKCWRRIEECIVRNINNIGSDPKLDPSNPAYDNKAFYCCTLIQNTFDADTDCFCSIDDFLHEVDPDTYYVSLAVLACDGGSLTRFDELCAGHLTPPAKP